MPRGALTREVTSSYNGYMQRIVGVIGGLGPDATVDFMAQVIAVTPADKDQDHVRMLVDQNPHVPNRQDALAGTGDDPGPQLAAMAAELQRAGADFLVMPCNTAHAWTANIEKAVTIPFVSIVDETIAACADHTAIGLLSTTGCLHSNVYQDGLATAGKQPVLPNDAELAQLMELVFRVKQGEKSSEMAESMLRLAEALVDRGAEVVVVACTEIPLVLDAERVTVPVINSTEVLARSTVAHATSST